MVTSKAALVAGLTLAGQAAAALQPIVMKGTKFFYENGTQFYIKGIAYQQDTTGAGGETTTGTFKDPLADADACKRDVPIMKAAGTNAIRTYAIDPTKDHSACMKLLDDAGIYVISDLSEPAKSINRDDPRWDVTLFKRYTSVIDELSKYDNVIGFFAGNEVSNNATNTKASAYVKAAVRDSKKYIKDNVKRWMGVGYAANDDPNIRAEIAHYFNCGDQDQAIDFWGYNIYEWCGESSIKKSGYQDQIDFFSNYSVPVFFAEYGCNEPGGAEGRIFQETTALYNEKVMTDVFSGGIVYMYFQEENDYGLVKVSGNDAKTLKNYDKLKTAVLGAKPETVDMDSYTPDNEPAECPDVTKNWQVTGKALPPTPDESLCECMFNSLTCVPDKNLKAEEYGDIFGTVCGNDKDACAGILGDPSTGVYGAYAMCNAKQQLGYVMDQYYKNQKYASHACSFNGAASPNGSGKADASCSAALKSADAANAVAATATAGSGNGGTDGGDAAAATSSSFASPVAMKSFFSVADMAVGLYVVVAMGVGAGMVML
ncbi:Glucanosyltransferase-domain-containing protein [Sordaria brevicollis]|uniref:1,3-beta-glucanosyltransferase n=1 Tax=Sordaria brevicollis TaxID=83679 RepID=A0AAE0PMJ4_SORBR|nr:Glucanosyltransferase-domain-containing protein [Sordaria brevicollis]